ncbi:hypothetical protein JHW45_17440 [Paracoccus stylophorae]|uniref:Uncharacterized protein n=1 Tax=Paracoccus stylophorae TaxID=659350 RepID=A0ABY7SVC2_9RHOB|nr:hypothetical protein [Paracoccus stylophorae]WCR10789.1 hypothetical protein JHW45_17440 [Paracoccus stylophorae]
MKTARPPNSDARFPFFIAADRPDRVMQVLRRPERGAMSVNGEIAKARRLRRQRVLA